MTMPTRYRERLQAQCNGQLILTIDPEERCLWLYPLPVWEEIERVVDALPGLDKASRRIQRLLIGHARCFNEDTQLFAGLNREGSNDAVERVADRLHVFHASNISVHRSATRSRTRIRNDVRRLNDES